MAAFICVVSGRFPENYQIGLQARTWGVEEKYSAKIEPVNRGDLVFFFIEGHFRSLHEVTREAYVDHSPLWPEKDGSMFPHRVGLSDPIAVGNVALTDVSSRISFMRDKQQPTGTLQGPNGVFNARMTPADVEVVRSRMRSALPSRMQIAPEAAQQSVERHKAIFRLYEHDLDDQILRLLATKGIVVQNGCRNVQTGVDVIDGIGIDPHGRVVVVDINRGCAPDEALLQVLRHMSWVRQNQAEGREVRGLIVAEAADRALADLVKEVPNVDIQLFRLTLELIPQPLPPSRAAAC